MRKPFLLPVISLVLIGLTVFLGYFVQRTDFQSFIAAYTAFFGLYVWIVFYQRQHFSVIETRALLWLGIGLRVLLLFSLPNLSDDYARFLWDGHLSVAGIHPFLHPPSYFIDNQIFPPGITLELFGKINSPGYYTVYPPVCQGVFMLAAWLFPTSELGGVFVMKLFLLACELGTLQLLWSNNKGFEEPGKDQRERLPNLLSHEQSATICNRTQYATLAYALNPLIILEICGNCHFEGAMIFFLLAGVAALQRVNLVKGAIFWALATASKILPIMFLPIVWRWLGWRKGLVFNLVFAAAGLLIFAPVLAVLPNILASLDLYFRKFQFNASIYYLVREVGFSKIGWDIGEYSGPALGGITMIGVLLLAFLMKGGMALIPSGKAPFKAPSKSGFKGVNAPFLERINAILPAVLLFALMIYLSLAATVQPWYVTVVFALSLSTNWRFAVVWSGTAALSYSHYDGGGLQENYVLIGLEYGILWAFLLWELWQRYVRKPAQKFS